MRFNILGPLTITDDAGKPVVVRRPLHRAMIAFLLLREGQPSSAAELIAALWGDEPPRRVDDSLRSCVYGVRRLLPDTGRLCTRRPGYLIRCEPRELDLADFRDLANRGLTALDDDARGLGFGVLHDAARAEVQYFVDAMKLPINERGKRSAIARAEWVAAADKPLETDDLLVE